MVAPSNYIPGDNPYNLAGPPLYWLRQLHEFDPSLVVFASKQDFLYRLAQRRPLDPRAKLAGELARDSDSAMLANHGCIPVTTLLATARWDNPLMWKDLEGRCPWRNGGADKYHAQLLAQERAQDLQKAIQQNDYNTHLAKDAWKMYQIKTGVRLGLVGSNKPAPRPANGSAMIKILGPDGQPTSTRL